MNTIETLDPTPFRHLIMTIGELPSSFVDSMSYYEMLAWLCNYVEKNVVTAINNNAAAVEEIQQWISTLDLQDEVDSKLEEMAEDGTLAEIINQEIFGEINEQVSQNTNDISSLNTSLDNLEEKVDFAQIRTTQTLIKDFEGLVSFQGSCIDDNNILYQYVNKDQATGDLYRFDITNHQYIDAIEGIEFNHGNDLCFKDGYIWAACTNDGTNDNTKIASYNISTGVQSVYNPFTELGYSRTFSICDNNTPNELLVGLLKISGTSGYRLNQISFVKFNTNTLQYQEYEINLNHQYIGANIPSNIERVGNKLYLMSATKNYIYLFDIDDENLTMTLEKIYDLGLTDELGLVFGELEGFTKFPSQYYFKDTFVISAYTAEDNSSKCCIKYYLINPESDIKGFDEGLLGSNFNMRQVDIHVNANATNESNWLIENGSSSYPFKSLGRAIEFVSNNKLNLRIGDIVIDDNSTYNIGQLAGVNCSIFWGSHTPTFTWMVAKATNTTLSLRGNAKANLNISGNTLNITSSTISMYNMVINKQIYATRSRLTMTSCDINISTTVVHAIIGEGSIIMCNIGTASGYSGNVLQGYDGCYVQINHDYENAIGGSGGTVVQVANT